MTQTLEETIILQNDKVRLIPFEGEGDFEYLYSLLPTYKYNISNREEAKKAVERYGHLFWIGYGNGIKMGVVYTSYLPEVNCYTLDGYLDDKVAKRVDSKISFGYEAGKLVSDYILENVADAILTAHDIKNRGATIMCKRMGFVEEETRDGVIVMRRRKTWA